MRKPRTDLLETKAVALILHVREQRVRQLVKAGHLHPAIVTARGGRLFEPAEVERVRKARENKAKARAA